MARNGLHGPHDLDVAQEVAALARDEVVRARQRAGKRLLGDRLDQEVDGVEADGGYGVVHRRPPRHEDELGRRPRSAARQARGERQAVETRHAQVEEDDADVGRLGHHVEGKAGVPRLADRVPHRPHEV